VRERRESDQALGRDETRGDQESLASTDPNTTEWISLGLMKPTNGIWRLLDTGAFSNGWRFYRADQVP
jgi:hypothetical protein